MCVRVFSHLCRGLLTVCRSVNVCQGPRLQRKSSRKQGLSWCAQSRGAATPAVINSPVRVASEESSVHCYLSAPWLVPHRAPPWFSRHETTILLLFAGALSAVLSEEDRGRKGRRGTEGGKGQRGVELYADCLYSGFREERLKVKESGLILRLKHCGLMGTVINLNVD